MIFIGEKRSKTAIKNGWTWESGHLAAKQLMDALKTIGVGMEGVRFGNVFDDEGNPIFDPKSTGGARVIAMGMIAHEELTRLGVEHDTIVHPAARGKIRRKDRYAEHLRGIIYKA